MKERPILFSGEMVNAILDGRKTQTRRVAKPSVPERIQHVTHSDDKQLWGMYHKRKGEYVHTRCPYGKPGDRLWVREAHVIFQQINYFRRPDGAAYEEVSDGMSGYKADGFDSVYDFREHLASMANVALEAVRVERDGWRPSIHMPRWASRINLEITDIRVERVQSISEEDAEAEGVQPSPLGDNDNPDPNRHIMEFSLLWDSINTKRGFGWETNPWVWVVEFKKLT